MPGRAEQGEVAEIPECREGTEQEIGKPRVPGSDEAPENAQQHEPADRVAGPDMQRHDLVFGEISDEEGNGQRPVEEPHEGVPDAHVACRRLCLNRRRRHRHCPPSM